MWDNSGKESDPGFSLENTIKAIGNREIALKAIRMFVAVGEEEYLQPLRKSIDENDKETIFKTSHKLYGLASRLKIKGIADPAGQIVNASRKKKEIDYNKYCSEIFRIFEELKKRYSTL